MGRLRKDNTSGYQGVVWNKKVNKWGVNIQINKKSIHLGQYKDLDDAVKAYKAAIEKYNVQDRLLPGLPYKEYQMKYREMNKEQRVAYDKKRYEKFKEQKKAYQRNRNLQLRLQMIQAYGGQCECCGEKRMEFLSIDHINGNGNAHRKETKMRGGYQMYCWLKSRGWPKDDYRLLCYNCNLSHGFFGYCPHEREKDDV